jgi:hypothetical protein
MLVPYDLRFGNEGFEHLIDTVLAAGYSFARFDIPPLPAAHIFRLRFDVDISPGATLALADILRRRGVHRRHSELLPATQANFPMGERGVVPPERSKMVLSISTGCEHWTFLTISWKSVISPRTTCAKWLKDR